MLKLCFIFFIFTLDQLAAVTRSIQTPNNKKRNPIFTSEEAFQSPVKRQRSESVEGSPLFNMKAISSPRSFQP